METKLEQSAYYIAFDTQINPGKVEAIRVRIDVVTIDDMEQKLPVNLADHPLYSDIARYVRLNP
jgi:hypothetical protein